VIPEPTRYRSTATVLGPEQQPASASGTSTVTVGDRDLERLEAENAPVYVPMPDGLGGSSDGTYCAVDNR
jgi:hypothetical protein